MSAVRQSTKASRVLALQKTRSHLAQKQAALTKARLSKPSIVLGYSHAQEGVWQNSLLRSLMVKREDVWGVQKGSDEKKVDGRGLLGLDGDGEENTVSSAHISKNMNFGMDSVRDDLASFSSNTFAHTLSINEPFSLPSPPSSKSSASAGTSSFLDQVRVQEMMDSTKRQQETMDRVLGLGNADSAGIRKWNIEKVVEAFRRNEKDTASPEVQAAISTVKIHSIYAHILQNPSDIKSVQTLRSYIASRAKILKYLRRIDFGRYEVLLPKIGVVPGAVEGEIFITRKEMRGLIGAGRESGEGFVPLPH